MRSKQGMAFYKRARGKNKGKRAYRSDSFVHKEYPMRTILLFFSILLSVDVTSALTLHVGVGYPYNSLEAAADDVIPGDTILVHEGTYSGGIFIADLQGLESSWIYIVAAEGEMVIFEGGNNAWQFTDAAYLHIKGFVFQHQAGNGLNFDDGGSYDSPAHHIIFEDCVFRDMNASGNNDLLKLSGLDSFEVRQCTFINGASGGSGIDMVGCHDGTITGCHFENLGSNSIQAKGGTRNIRIERNFFKNGGARAVNLGGSTGLQFFRPIDAPFESAELKVYSNIFIGSEAPVAFVGTINTEVINNTIYLPGKWVMRILQETVDTTRFPPCGYNTFRNNIIYFDDRVSVECNIGPNTAPETFTFSNNLWFHSEDSGWPGPDLPVNDVDNIVGEDPLFVETSSENFTIMEESPAVGNGYQVILPELDYAGNAFIIPRSIGAFEGGEITGVDPPGFIERHSFHPWPNPADGELNVMMPKWMNFPIEIQIVHTDGQILYRKVITEDQKNNFIPLDIKFLPTGAYHVIVMDKKTMISGGIIIQHP